MAIFIVSEVSVSGNYGENVSLSFRYNGEKRIKYLVWGIKGFNNVGDEIPVFDYCDGRPVFAGKPMLDVVNLLQNASFVERYRQKGPYEPYKPKVRYNNFIQDYFKRSSFGKAASCKIVFVAVDFMDGTHQVFYGNDIEIGEKSGDCYVATCVYGSYDCPEVWTLRRYRDDTLASTWYGRAFVRLYYAVSPTLVRWFGKTKWFQRLFKGRLDRMVKSLREKGVEDTPYRDKEWK